MKNNKITINEFLKILAFVHGEKSKMAFVYLCASLFRKEIMSTVGFCPLLGLSGPKASGKTKIGHLLMSFVKKNKESINTPIVRTSYLKRKSRQQAKALIHFDNYEHNIEVDKSMFIKNLWSDYDIECGAIVSGIGLETKDPELLSKMVLIQLNRHCLGLDRIIKIMDQIEEEGLTHITDEIKACKEDFECNFERNYYLSLKKLEGLIYDFKEVMIIRNWAILLATYQTLQPCLKLIDDYEDITTLCYSMIVNQYSELKKFIKQ